MAKIGIIGGTGLYQLDGLEATREHQMRTPFGAPSHSILEGKIGPHQVFFLPRHGNKHQLLPHEVNYRANLFALKQLDVKQLIGVSAIGSLRQALKPGHMVLPDQYIDWIKQPRDKSFFGQGVAAHISTARPVSARLSQHVLAQATALHMPIHAQATYVAVDGPRLGTQAESHFFRNAMQADVVGMTNVPEVFLANEAQIDYVTLGLVTDYDCWQEDPAQHVSVEEVIARFGASLSQAKQLLTALLHTEFPAIDEPARKRLKPALLTPLDALSKTQKEWLDILLT